MVDHDDDDDDSSAVESRAVQHALRVVDRTGRLDSSMCGAKSRAAHEVLLMMMHKSLQLESCRRLLLYHCRRHNCC